MSRTSTVRTLGILLVLCHTASVSAQTESPKTCSSRCLDLTLTPSGIQTVPVGGVQLYEARVQIPTGCPSASGTRGEFEFEPLTPGLQIQRIGQSNTVEVRITQAAHRTSRFQILVRLIGPPPFEQTLGSACQTLTIHVPDGVDPRPDLVTEAVQVPGGVLYADESFTVFGQIRNVGAASTSGSFQNRLYFNGSSRGTRTCNTLAAGGSCSPSWSVSGPEGFHEIKICADDSPVIPESHEGNNCRSRFVTLVERPLPDLLARTLQVDSSVLRVGEETEVDVLIDNVGTASASGFSVRLTTPDGTQETSCSSLAQGNTCTATFRWTPQLEGSAQLVGEADPQGLLSELDETNNQVQRFVTVEPPVALPDLFFHVDGVTMSPANPEVGDTITFTFRMHNSGEGIFGDPVAQMYISGSGVSRYFQCSEGIPNAGDCERSWSITALESGAQTITANADPFGEIAETFEDNNSRSLHYVVADSTTEVTCQGIWHLTGINGTELDTSSPGSVVDDCHVYFGQNTPTSCFRTSGPGGLHAVWHRQSGETCPSTVTVTSDEGDLWEFSISIQ